MTTGSNTTENRVRRINALAARGMRGGLTAGHHLGSDEVHHLCELVEAENRANSLMLKRLRELLEDAIDGSHDDDLAEAHGIVIAMLEGREP